MEIRIIKILLYSFNIIKVVDILPTKNLEYYCDKMMTVTTWYFQVIGSWILPLGHWCCCSTCFSNTYLYTSLVELVNITCINIL